LLLTAEDADKQTLSRLFGRNGIHLVAVVQVFRNGIASFLERVIGVT